jgi:hypothetical protein
MYSNTLDPVTINGYLTNTEPIRSISILSILSIIYISGAVFFSLRFLSSLAQIHYLYYRFPKYKFNGFTAVVLDNDQSPFTFFHILFISRIDFECGKIDEMIVHEKAHKDAFHTMDVLLLEIMTIIQWFNPFIWMFGRSLKSEHEFIADDRVIHEGFDKVKYQKLLFERSLGITSINLTNNFNYSLLKKRLKMMTNKKSSSLNKIKYLISMPIMLLTLMLLAVNLNSFGQADKVCTDVDVQAKYKSGSPDEIGKFIQQNLVYPKSAKDNKISAKIYVQFIIDETGNIASIEVVRTDILDNVSKKVLVKGYKPNSSIDSKSVADMETESIRVVKLLKDYKPAQKNGKNVKSQLTLPISFVLS